MKKLLQTMVYLAAFTFGLWTSAAAQHRSNRSDDDDFNDNFQDNPGVWSAVVYDDKVHIQFGGLHWSSSSTFMLNELGTLPADKPGTFVVKRDPGSVTFNGSFSNNRGHGTYLFVPDAAFTAYLGQEGFKDVSEELMLHLFFTNINKDYLGYMKQNGYDGLTLDQLKDLAFQNVNQKVMSGYLELFKQDGFGKVSVDQIIQLREHGVSPSFISSIHDLGYKNFSLDKAVELRDHGVSPDFISDIKKAGAADVTLDEAIGLRDHGVSVEFVRE